MSRGRRARGDTEKDESEVQQGSVVETKPKRKEPMGENILRRPEHRDGGQDV
jgi:hypothetical protein